MIKIIVLIQKVIIYQAMELNNFGYILKNIYKQKINYKEEFFMLKGQNGITLIALVITIIILLILAGITISLTLGEHGIINMGEKAGIMSTMH